MPFAAVFTAFALFAGPAMVLMAVWASVTLFRILFPERPLPRARNQTAERRAAVERGESVAVGFREIHEDMRVHARDLARPYHHTGGSSDGFPDDWLDDLHRRRN